MAMEDSTEKNIKRNRGDFDNSGFEFPESKLSRLDSYDSVADSTEFELDPDDSDVRSPGRKLIREHLLNMLDEADANDPTIQGLDSFIRSFEEEILTPAPAPASDSGDSRPDLGYLLEASDDELGLPPSFSSEQKMETVIEPGEGLETTGFGFGEIIGLDDQIPGYGSFGFGFCGGNPENNQNSNDDFVAVGTLFDHTENCEPLDVSAESGWRSESLSAV